jgi:hypothetical protein
MPGRRERIKAAGFPIAAESIDGAGELPQGDIFYQPPFLRPAEMPISRVYRKRLSQFLRNWCR